MSRLRTAFGRYIGMRQGLGYKYDGPAKRLSEFVAFMESRGAETITNDLAMEGSPRWAGSQAGPSACLMCAALPSTSAISIL